MLNYMLVCLREALPRVADPAGSARKISNYAL